MTNTEEKSYWTQRVIEFLRSIGLTVEVSDEAAAPPESFLPGVMVRNGGLVVYPGAFPGDLLHEAGHLCTLCSPFRELADGNLSKAFAEITRYMRANPEGLLKWPEDPVSRAAMQCSDPEATAWQYAAAQHIGLPDKWLFPKGSYAGNAATTLMALKTNSYMGINGLQAAGWTYARRNPSRPEQLVYPKLAFWMHPGADLPQPNFAGA